MAQVYQTKINLEDLFFLDLLKDTDTGLYLGYRLRNTDTDDHCTTSITVAGVAIVELGIGHGMTVSELFDTPISSSSPYLRRGV